MTALIFAILLSVSCGENESATATQDVTDGDTYTAVKDAISLDSSSRDVTFADADTLPDNFSADSNTKEPQADSITSTDTGSNEIVSDDIGGKDNGLDSTQFNRPDLSGKWAHINVSSCITRSALSGESGSVTTSTYPLTISQDGPVLDIHTELCDLTIESTNQLSPKIIVPDNFIDAIAPVNNPALVKKSRPGN